jgi:hypothetical protein
MSACPPFASSREAGRLRRACAAHPPFFLDVSVSFGCLCWQGSVPRAAAAGLYSAFTIPTVPEIAGIAKRTNSEHNNPHRNHGTREGAMFTEIRETVQDVIAFGALSLFTVTLLVWGNVVAELLAV